MADKTHIVVDGLSLDSESGVTLLSALRTNGVEIPSLCYHSQLEPQGRCSLCIIEIYNQVGWQAKHACMIHCEPGLEIRTNSAGIHRLRAWAADMLLARGPFEDVSVEQMLKGVLKAAEAAGVRSENLNALLPTGSESTKSISADTDSPLKTMPPGCILCGLCISMCRKVGKNKLTFLGKGTTFRISYVNNPSDTDACGTCHACQQVCPTAYIQSNGRDAFSAKLYRPR